MARIGLRLALGLTLKLWTGLAPRLLVCLALGLVSPLSLTAATRCYYPSTGTAPASPSYSAGWEDTADAIRLPLTCTTGGATPLTSQTATDTSAVAATDILNAQWVSPPLDIAQTVDGTIKGQFRASQSAGTMDSRAQIVLRVVSNDGSTVRCTLQDFDTSALSSEYAASVGHANNVNRKFPLSASSPATLTSCSALACDRIVIEVGARSHGTTTGGTVNILTGDGNATDLPENETATTTTDPWIEFSDNLTFASEGPCGGGGAARRVIVIGK